MKSPTIQSTLGIDQTTTTRQFLLTVNKPLSQDDNKQRQIQFHQLAQSASYVETARCKLYPAIFKISKSSGMSFTNSSSEPVALTLSTQKTILIPKKSTVLYKPLQSEYPGQTGYISCINSSVVEGAYLITK